VVGTLSVCPAAGEITLDGSMLYVAGKPFVTIVDETGRYEIQLPPGDHDLTVQIATAFSDIRRVTGLAEGETRLLDIQACIADG
jgi:hypothetical protein